MARRHCCQLALAVAARRRLAVRPATFAARCLICSLAERVPTPEAASHLLPAATPAEHVPPAQLPLSAREPPSVAQQRLEAMLRGASAARRGAWCAMHTHSGRGVAESARASRSVAHAAADIGPSLSAAVGISGSVAAVGISGSVASAAAPDGHSPGRGERKRPSQGDAVQAVAFSGPAGGLVDIGVNLVDRSYEKVRA
eukprot:364133-Chlamydomonas_euryale.AAC.2